MHLATPCLSRGGNSNPAWENLAELAKQSPHPEPNPPHTAPDLLTLAGRGGEEWMAVRVEAAFEPRVLTRVLTRSRWSLWRCLTPRHAAALGGTLTSSPVDSGWEPAALMLVDEAAEHPSPLSSRREDSYSDRLPETRGGWQGPDPGQTRLTVGYGSHTLTAREEDSAHHTGSLGGGRGGLTG